MEKQIVYTARYFIIVYTTSLIGNENVHTVLYSVILRVVAGFIGFLCQTPKRTTVFVFINCLNAVFV